MKKTTTNLIVAGLMLSTSAFAQSSKLSSALQSNPVSNQGTLGKSTATMSRPIASGVYNFTNGVTYEFQDSVMIAYSGERGVDSAFTDIKYDMFVSMKVISNVLTNQAKSNRTYDANDNHLTQLDQLWNNGLSTWENDENNIHTYDANNNRLTHINQNWNSGTSSWDNSQKYIYTYDGNNNMLTYVRQYWDGGTMAWVNAEKQLYSYDANDNQLTNIQQYWNSGTMSWDNSMRTTNTYNGDDDKTNELTQFWNGGTMSWDNNNQHIYTYDGDHHMLTDIYQTWVLAVWQNNTKRTQTFNGDDLMSVTAQNWNAGTSSWDNVGKNVYAYDANHNRTSDIEQTWNAGTNSFENDTRDQTTYNSYNQPTMLWDDEWNSGIWEVTTSNTKQHIYYEEYTTAGLGNVAAASDFNLYPVPANNYVRIEKSFTQPQDFTVTITDLQGRVVRHISEKATSNYTRAIDVNQYAAGSYIIKIAPVSGKVSYQQFSVIH